MPVEKQAERLGTPLARRDRRFLVVLGIVTALAILAGAVYAATRGGDPAGARCFTATYASSVGGATVHRCGPAAVYFCRVNAGVAEIAAACRHGGFTAAKKR